MEYLIGSLIGLVVAGGAAAAVVMLVIVPRNRSDREKARVEAETVLAGAKQEAEALRVSARDESYKLREQFEKEIGDTRNELKQFEKRLLKKEDVLDQRVEELQGKERRVQETEKALQVRAQEADEKHRQLDRLMQEERETLQRVAGLSRDEAVQLLLGKLRPEVDKEMGDYVTKQLERAKETSEEQARKIIALAIQRFASDHTAKMTVSMVDLPNEEMKGRIIGREGRNIRAFERATGVDVIVDDTPGVIILSCFDSIRREMARRSMEKLVLDGRIHPTRVEEVVEQTKKELEEQIIQTGKQFLYEQDIHGVHPKLVTLLGRMRFRTSYGQTLLQHIKEVAHVCGVLASELKLNPALARRCGIFHDIGKAVDMEMEGTHPQIGADLLKRFGEGKEVVDAALSHHGDMNPESPYTVIVAAADAISASRPGARGESIERYVKRLEKLEQIAQGTQGVEAAFAIQAGRELRVIVNAGKVDDKQAVLVARDIAREIERELTYPGEIKVTVIRETRIVEYAR